MPNISEEDEDEENDLVRDDLENRIKKLQSEVEEQMQRRMQASEGMKFVMSYFYFSQYFLKFVHPSLIFNILVFFPFKHWRCAHQKTNLKALMNVWNLKGYC